MTGDMIDAKTALALGLVNQVVAPDQLMADSAQARGEDRLEVRRRAAPGQGRAARVVHDGRGRGPALRAGGVRGRLRAARIGSRAPRRSSPSANPSGSTSSARVGTKPFRRDGYRFPEACFREAQTSLIRTAAKLGGPFGINNGSSCDYWQSHVSNSARPLAHAARRFGFACLAGRHAASRCLHRTRADDRAPLATPECEGVSALWQASSTVMHYGTRTYEAQRSARDTARRFAREKLDRVGVEIDRTIGFPPRPIAELGRLGMMGIFIPEKYGGAGLDHVSYALVVEELAVECASTAVIVSAHSSLASWPILGLGNERSSASGSCRRWRPANGSDASRSTEPQAGSDAAGQKTTRGARRRQLRHQRHQEFHHQRRRRPASRSFSR